MSEKMYSLTLIRLQDAMMEVMNEDNDLMVGRIEGYIQTLFDCIGEDDSMRYRLVYDMVELLDDELNNWCLGFIDRTIGILKRLEDDNYGRS